MKTRTVRVKVTGLGRRETDPEEAVTLVVRSSRSFSRRGSCRKLLLSVVTLIVMGWRE